MGGVGSDPIDRAVCGSRFSLFKETVILLSANACQGKRHCHSPGNCDFCWDTSCSETWMTFHDLKMEVIARDTEFN